MKKLKSLKEHDDMVMKHLHEKTKPNGIACPLCGEELIDVHPGTVLTSYPAQMTIKCEKCVWTGYRYV